MIIKIVTQKPHANPDTLYDEVSNLLLDVDGDQGVLFINENDIALIYSHDEKRIIGCIKFLQDIKISTPEGIRGIKHRTMILYKWFGWKNSKVVVCGVGSQEQYKDTLMGLVSIDLYKYNLNTSLEFEDSDEVGLFLDVLNMLSIEFSSNYTQEYFSTHNMCHIELKHPRTFNLDFDMLSDRNKGFRRIQCSMLIWNILNFTDIKTFVHNIEDLSNKSLKVDLKYI